jgi:TonB family protein
VKPPKASDVPKITTPVKTPATTTPKLDLTPTVRNNTTKAKEKAEAAEREARAAAQKDANFRKELASKIDRSSGAELSAGFKDGVKVEVGGPGGQAYAGYALFVREIYENAWQVMPDLANQDFAVTIEVTVSRTGRVLNHRIVNRSGNAAMDRSIQRAMDKVKATGLPKFPDESTDGERTFSIPFNLKAKRLLG